MLTREQLTELEAEITKRIEQLDQVETVGLTPWWLIELVLAAKYAFDHGYGFSDTVPKNVKWS